MAAKRKRKRIPLGMGTRRVVQGSAKKRATQKQTRKYLKMRAAKVPVRGAMKRVAKRFSPPSPISFVVGGSVRETEGLQRVGRIAAVESGKVTIQWYGSGGQQLKYQAGIIAKRVVPSSAPPLEPKKAAPIVSASTVQPPNPPKWKMPRKLQRIVAAHKMDPEKARKAWQDLGKTGLPRSLVFEVISGAMTLEDARKRHSQHTQEVQAQRVQFVAAHKSWMRFPEIVRGWLHSREISESQANELMALARRKPALPIKLLKRVVRGFMSYEQALKSQMPVIRAEQAERDRKRFDRDTMQRMMNHGSLEHNKGVSDIYGSSKKLQQIVMPQGRAKD